MIFELSFTCIAGRLDSKFSCLYPVPSIKNGRENEVRRGGKKQLETVRRVSIAYVVFRTKSLLFSKETTVLTFWCRFILIHLDKTCKEGHPRELLTFHLVQLGTGTGTGILVR